MIIKILTLTTDLLLKILQMELIYKVWVPLLIGIMCFKFIYGLTNYRD